MKFNLTRKQAEEFEPILVSVLLNKLIKELPEISESDDFKIDVESLRFCYTQKDHNFHFDPEENVEELNEMSLNELKAKVLKEFFSQKVIFGLVIDSEEAYDKEKKATYSKTMIFGYDGDEFQINKENIKTLFDDIFESKWFSKLENNSERLMVLNYMLAMEPPQMSFLEYHYKKVSKNPIELLPDEIKEEVFEYEKTGRLSEKMQEFINVVSGIEISEFGTYTEDGQTKKLATNELTRLIVQADGRRALKGLVDGFLEKLKNGLEEVIKQHESEQKTKTPELTLDELLDKVSENGIESLTEQERERLDKLSGN